MKRPCLGVAGERWSSMIARDALFGRRARADFERSLLEGFTR
jgi:hypothetical protein